MSGLRSQSKPVNGAFYLNGVSRPRKPLKKNVSKARKKPTLDHAKRLANWSGYDGHRGCVVYIFDRALSRCACEHFGLRFPAIEPGVYCTADAPMPDKFHPDKIVAVAAVGRGRP